MEARNSRLCGGSLPSEKVSRRSFSCSSGGCIGRGVDVVPFLGCRRVSGSEFGAGDRVGLLEKIENSRRRGWTDSFSSVEVVHVLKRSGPILYIHLGQMQVLNEADRDVLAAGIFVWVKVGKDGDDPRECLILGTDNVNHRVVICWEDRLSRDVAGD